MTLAIVILGMDGKMLFNHSKSLFPTPKVSKICAKFLKTYVKSKSYDIIVIEHYYINYRIEGDVFILTIDKEIENAFGSELELHRVRSFLSNICKGDIKAEILLKRNFEIYFGIERVFDMLDADPMVVTNQKGQISSHFIEQPAKESKVLVPSEEMKHLSFKNQFENKVEQTNLLDKEFQIPDLAISGTDLKPHNFGASFRELPFVPKEKGKIYDTMRLFLNITEKIDQGIDPLDRRKNFQESKELRGDKVSSPFGKTSPRGSDTSIFKSPNRNSHGKLTQKILSPLGDTKSSLSLKSSSPPVKISGNSSKSSSQVIKSNVISSNNSSPLKQGGSTSSVTNISAPETKEFITPQQPPKEDVNSLPYRKKNLPKPSDSLINEVPPLNIFSESSAFTSLNPVDSSENIVPVLREFVYHSSEGKDIRRFYVIGELSFVILSEISSPLTFNFQFTNGLELIDEIKFNPEYIKDEGNSSFRCTLTNQSPKNVLIQTIKYRIESKFVHKFIPLRLLPSWQETQNCTNFLLLYEMNPKVTKINDCIVSVSTINLSPEINCIFKPEGEYSHANNRAYWVIEEISNKSRKGKLIAQFVTPTKVKSESLDVVIDFSVEGMIISGLDFQIDSNTKFVEIERSFKSAYYFGKH
eukprot:TRINITY_DN839_c1_g1_i1.p1 TRINITY_DN839_c1_g1~~TRINITY_DN839_c1_g1_i1.p1  ORF type:complete len:641 (-),score=167.82 TRINITY_DN839_c1_g1_i1:34-1956(-)